MEFSPELQQLLKEKKVTNRTTDRVFVAKNYIEKKYQMKKVSEEERKKGKHLINYIYICISLCVSRMGMLQ